MIEDLEQMTNAELRKTKVALTLEKENGPITNEKQYKKLKEVRTKETIQGKLVSYICYYTLAFIITRFMDKGNALFTVSTLAYGFLIITSMYWTVVYLILPKLTTRRILTYTTRFNLLLLFYFAVQLYMDYIVFKPYLIKFDKEGIFVMLFIVVGIGACFIQSGLEKLVYSKREKGIYQAHSLTDEISRKLFEYEQMSNEQLEAEISKVEEIDKRIQECYNELKARKIEADSFGYFREE